MDFINDWRDYLPDPSYITRLSTVNTSLMQARNSFYSLMDRLTSASPSLTTIALLLIILFLSLKLLDMLWRAVMFWVTLVARLLFVGAIAALAFWFWSRGPDGMVEDVQHWSVVWWNEYQGWENKLNIAKDFRLQMGGAAGGVGGAARAGGGGGIPRNFRGRAGNRFF